MTEQYIIELLRLVAEGTVAPDEAAQEFHGRPLCALADGITLDTQRLSRTGVGEVVLATGKTPEQVVAAVDGLSKAGEPVLATRVDAEQGNALVENLPTGSYHKVSGLFALDVDLGLDGPWDAEHEVVVVTAGASDMGVALEAYGTACFLGLDCGLVSDVGVAGVHRLAPHLPALRKARAVIAVAGMDGALPSLLAGLLPVPIVGVPSSQGGGNPMGGVSAMLAMLNSCSPGITVCNVDNGFGAAAFVAKAYSSFWSDNE